MKLRSCEPSFAGSGRLALGPPEPKSFFANKSRMALLAATSGTIALLMAAKAGKQMIVYENMKACQRNNENAEDTGGNNAENKSSLRPILYDPVLACIFRGGFNQHMVHSAALLAVPYVAGQPILTTGLLIGGIITYCGTQYYKAFNREPDCCNESLVLGTIALIGAWLSFLI